MFHIKLDHIGISYLYRVVLKDSIETESDILSPGRFRPGPPRNNATPIDLISWGFLMPARCETMA